MFWRGGQETPEEGLEQAREAPTGPIQIERDAPRPATILRVAGELEERGGTILELFKEIESPLGVVVMPIHFRQDDEDFFVEVATGPWNGRRSNEAVDRAAIVRSSEYADAGLEILSGYPVPSQVEFFFGRSPAALLQLDLARLTPDLPEVAAGLFREVGSSHWGVDLDYEPGYLPLVEELIIAVLDADEANGPPPLSDGLVAGLGCFLGETIRRNVSPPGAWRPPEEWGEGPVIEIEGFVLDPIGKARAFLERGPEESLTFYAEYTLQQFDGESDNGVEDPRKSQA
ncbi:hypothetical protein AVDCRST_MAG82-2285 [uncultured Rubrobacteraceae bacterium]|uniref:Uncharacterized protein n=1 Tax=uncultured Rubrobacteraceae bacterium TaxID=349277 RepID=A0A6J4Q8K2_9ACTN|nr:hypothetical protein AVDCRST_MAG82-2285 [uncultured Rubrobacteraceae bacterium]